MRRLPRGIQTRLFRWLRGSLASRLESRVRVGSLDLERSRAFSEESSTLPGVWVLDPSCKEELIRSLRRWEAVRRVHRREDLYRGPLRGRAPDILLELRHSPTRTPPGYLGPSLRKLEGWELDGERGRGLNGVHRPEGLVAVRGPGFPGRGAITGAWIGDLAPTLLARMQIEIPSWMEGQPLSPLNDEPAWCDRAPVSFPGKDPQTHTMTRVERARLERRLRALGYLG